MERIGEQFEAVLGAARVGAPWAFQRLWAVFSPTVAGYLRLQGASEPEDLTSEVFLGVFTGLSRFEGGEDAFRSWVFTIAHHRLTDARRRAGRRPVVVEDGLERVAPISTGSAEDESLARLGEERVRRVCHQLVPDQRDVMLLRLVGGFTVGEVARVLDKSPGAVKSLQRRGVAALRRIMLAEGVPL